MWAVGVPELAKKKKSVCVSAWQVHPEREQAREEKSVLY